MLITAGIAASAGNQHEKVDYQVVHAIVGRIRIRIPRLAVAPAYAVKLQQLVESLNFVTSVRLNPLASSIIVQYRASAISNAIQEHLSTCIQQAGVEEGTKGTKFTPVQPELKLENAGIILADFDISRDSPHASPDAGPEGELAMEEPLSRSEPLLLTSEDTVPIAVTEELSLPEALPSDTFVIASPNTSDEKQAIPNTAISTASAAVTKSVIKAATASSVKLRLSQNDLAKRLGVTTQALTHQRTKPKFNEWSKARDPEQKTWVYASATKSFYTDERTHKAKLSDAAHSERNGQVEEGAATKLVREISPHQQ